MDFKDELLILAERVGKLKDNVKTEEATKTSFVLPFLQALGYDNFQSGRGYTRMYLRLWNEERRKNRLYRMYGRRADHAN